MVGSRFLKVEDCFHGSLLEPRVLVERQEELSLVNEKPEAVRRYVGYFKLEKWSFQALRISCLCFD